MLYHPLLLLECWRSQHWTHAGLFQIVGPMAFPSAADLGALEEGPATKASIQSLPSRRLAASSPRLSMQAGDFGGRKPSLDAQLRPIDSKPVRGWLPHGSKSRSVVCF